MGRENMRKTDKVNILYRIASGEYVQLSSDERRELGKYRVDNVGKPLNTKTNVSQYVTAVDNGYRKSFYDWCLYNNKGDRRMKAGKESSLKAFNQGQSFGVAATGWLVWGLALYWLFGGKLAVGACAIIGAIVSLALFKLNRQGSTFTCIILPIIIAVICATR